MHEQTWPGQKGERHTGRVPAHVAVFIDQIGVDLTFTLIMEFGGSVVYLPLDRVTAGSRLSDSIGAEAALKLSLVANGANRGRIPLAPKFLARHMRGQGLPTHEIARLLRRSDVSIREFLKPDKGFEQQKALRRAERFEQHAKDLRQAAED